MTGIELAHVTLATISTIIMVGLGFLDRPDRATMLWSLAFILTMASAYAQLAADEAGLEAMRVGAIGMGLGAPTLIWAGLRADRGESALAGWAGLAMGAGSAALLALSSGTDAYDWAFRIVYALAAVFAGLTLLELMRRPERGGGTSFPLAMFSITFVAIAAVSLAAGLITPALDLLRDINMLGLLVYLVCALVTLLFIIRGDVVTRGKDGTAGFLTIAADRLSRAQASGERSWTMLVVRLDDADDLRTAAGESGFTALATSLSDDVYEIFPTEADIGQLDTSTIAVLVARPSSMIRENVRTLLRNFSAPQRQNTVGVQCSASVGWVSVAELGYDAGTLLTAATDAAVAASVAGGDRWERVKAAAG